VRSYWHHGRDAPLWYWRARDGTEVDLLIEEDGLVFPVEVKLTASPSRRTAAAISRLQKAGLEVGPGAVVCLAESSWSLCGQVSVVPASWVR